MSELASYFRVDTRPVNADPVIVELAILARGVAREGWLTEAMILPGERGGHCAACHSASNVLPQRVSRRERICCVLLCGKCQEMLRSHGKRPWLYRDLNKSMSEINFDEVLLFKQGQRIRMVSGEKLATEVLV